MSEEIVSAILSLISAPDLESEEKLLKSIKDLLTNQENTSYFFSQQQETLNDFVTYIFNRRFGWSDGEWPETRSGSSSFIEGNKMKKLMNEITDQFINFFKEQPIAGPVLGKCYLDRIHFQVFSGYLLECSEALIDCSRSAVNKPVARKQTYQHVFDWVHFQLQQNQSHLQLDTNFDKFQCLTVAGLTDVWSAIRKTSSSGFESISDELTLPQLESLYEELKQIAFNENSSWQTKEGSIVGILAIINTFKLEPILHGSNDTNKTADKLGFNATYFHLKHNGISYNGLPHFLNDIPSVLYKLLADPQLSIREYTIKAFDSFLQRSKYQETLDSLAELTSRLLSNLKPGLLSDSVEFELQNLRKSTETPWLTDAYESEAILVTYLLYLSHPASTVRQGSSVLFKELLSKNQLSYVFQLMLQSLAVDWSLENFPEIQEAFSKVPPLTTPQFLKIECLQVNTWESIEGRFLALELLLKFLLTNYSHYILPFSAVKKSSDQSGLLSPRSALPISPFSTTSLHHRSMSNLYVSPSRNPTPEKPPSSQTPKRPGLTRSTSAETFTSPLKIDIPLSPTQQHNSTPISIIDQLLVKETKRVPLFEQDLSVIHFDSICDVLNHILLHITSCFRVDAQWELNRMAEQLLPLVSEVLFYIDANTLVNNFWIPYIRNESELLCFAASKSLKCVLRKVVALEENSLKFPDSYWSSLSDKERVLNQISSVEKVLPILISSIHSLAGLDSNLRLMVVNTELLLLYQTFWGNTSSEDRNKHIFTILKNFSLMNEAEIPNGQPKNVTKITKKAQFVRSTLLSSVHSVLPRFIVTCELDQMLSFIPDLLELFLAQDDPEIQSSLLESISRAFDFVVQVANGSTAMNTNSPIENGKLNKICDLCVSKLIYLIENKTLETILIRKVLDVFHKISLLWWDLRYLPHICHYVATSMNQEKILKILSVQQENSNLLQILSNDISQIPSISSPDSDSEDEELNSSKSSSIISDDSDWDNWDDEGEPGDADINSNINEVVLLLEKLSLEFATEFSPKTNEKESRKMLGLNCDFVSFPRKLQDVPNSQRSVVNWIMSKFGSKKS